MESLEIFIKTNFGITEPEEIKIIMSLFTFSTVCKGQYVLESGKPCNQMTFIQSGYLRVFNLCDGKEITQWISSKGEFSFDLSSFHFETPSRWMIQALINSELYVISKVDYKKIVDLMPKWNKIEQKFLIHCFTTMENRINAHLSMTAEERYDFFFNNNKELFNQVSLQYIASMLGMTPETMSRIRKRIS